MSTTPTPTPGRFIHGTGRTGSAAILDIHTGISYHVFGSEAEAIAHRANTDPAMLAEVLGWGGTHDPEGFTPAEPIQIVIGYDVRHWATFDVMSATPSEAAIFDGIDEVAILTLAFELHKAGRLTLTTDDAEEYPNPFEPDRNPAVID